MKKIIQIGFALCLPFLLHAQNPPALNLNFEKTWNDGRPMNWNLQEISKPESQFIAKLDSQVVKNGKYALSIEAKKNDEIKKSSGGIVYSIPAQYAGKRIILRGYIKTENVSAEGYASMWLRVDGNSGSLAFENLQKEHINGSHDWKEYEINLPLSSKAKYIVFGCFLASHIGKMWVDDMRLYIDDTPIEKVKMQNLSGAQRDSSFWWGSNIKMASITPEQVTDLALLGRIWGFLKYHHPEVTKGDVNWDFELFRILPKVLATKNATARDTVLLDWINSLGDIKHCNSCKEPRGTFTNKADHAWMNDTSIAKNLAEKLQFVYKNRNQGQSYYGTTTTLGGGDFDKEEAYPHLTNPDAGFRLLSLFRYWNIIHYYFPYKHLIKEDNWNEQLSAYIPPFLAANTRLEYIKTVQSLVVKVRDSHANAFAQNDSIFTAWQGKLYVPILLKYIENQVVVFKYAHDELGENTGLKIGDIVRTINNMPVDKVIEELKPYTSGSNDFKQKSNVLRRILRGNEPTVKIGIEREGQIMDFTITRVPAQGLNFSEWNSLPNTSFAKLKDEIGYISIGNIKQIEVEEAFKQFEGTKGLVLDIRNYPADFPIYKIGEYLTEKSTPFSRFARTDPRNPGYFELESNVLKVGAGKKHYEGKVAILINEVSQSSAEFHAMAFRVSKKAKVIGSQTSGADGNVSPFSLPGGIKTQITGIGCYYPDYSETQRIGIVPDIEIRPTLKGIKAGKDEVMEKAIEWIESEKD